MVVQIDVFTRRFVTVRNTACLAEGLSFWREMRSTGSTVNQALLALVGKIK